MKARIDRWQGEDARQKAASQLKKQSAEVPTRAREMAQHLRASADLAEGPDSIPSTQIVAHNCL